MSNNSSAFEEGSRFKQSKLKRPYRSRILIEKTNLTEELGHSLWDKYYPYVRSRNRASNESVTDKKSVNSRKSSSDSISSCDSISSIGSNKDLHLVSQKAVGKKASIEELNCVNENFDKLTCHQKGLQQNKSESENEQPVRQVVYYDAEKNIDYIEG